MTGPTGPTGRVVLVGTPIGHLGDLSPRAVALLSSADVLCCEDTRRTRALLSAGGISLSGRRLLSLHGHNEAARVPEVLAWAGAGLTVAVVSDAGMPGISDPGHRVVAAAAAAGIPVSVVPGPSSVLAALVVSGLPTERFCVEGFLPRKGAERRHRVESLADEPRTAVLLEAPGRLAGTLADLAAACGERPVAVARELTKVHEEVWRGTLADAADEFATRTVRGEVVVVVGGRPEPERAGDDEVAEAVSRHLAAGDGPRRVAEVVAAELGVGRRRAYELAIALRDGRPDPPTRPPTGA